MSKAAIRIIRNSKHVGTVPRETVADVVRTVGRDAKTGNLVVVKRNGDRVRTKRQG